VNVSESFVLDAMGTVSDEVSARFVVEIRAFVANLKAHPFRWDDPTFEVWREAMMRHLDDDPTSVLWVALARSRDLFAEVESLWAASAEW